MFSNSSNAPQSWLAFELNVLRRLKFESVILPFASETSLGMYLKRWNTRVLANDSLQSGWTKAVAAIENNSEKLSAGDVESVLENAYVPGYKLQNAALRKWFGETDAWWFENVSRTIEQLDSPMARHIALTIGMSVGDYALSFTDETRELRQPLSNVYRQIWESLPEPINNQQNNFCRNKSANEFIAENFMDLMFLQIPSAQRQRAPKNLGLRAWREEWLRGGEDFWVEWETEQKEKLGAPVETKSQYLQLITETLRLATHIPVWAIAHTENGFVSTQEIVEIINQIRPVDTIYTKDFSELTGAKAVIITV